MLHNPKQQQKYLSQIRSIIESNKKVLSGYKIRNIEFGTNTYNQAVRGGFSVMFVL